MKQFEELPKEEIVNCIVDRTDITFITSHEITECSQNLPIGVKKHISNGYLTKELFESLIGSLMFSGNSPYVNFNTLRIYTAYQGGKMYYTKIDDVSSKVEIEY